jgi:predicted DNA-binding protein with PD1-like motif
MQTPPPPPPALPRERRLEAHRHLDIGASSIPGAHNGIPAYRLLTERPERHADEGKKVLHGEAELRCDNLNELLADRRAEVQHHLDVQYGRPFVCIPLGNGVCPPANALLRSLWVVRTTTALTEGLVSERSPALRSKLPIEAASISGFGFVSKAKFGFFDFDRGDYDPKEFRDLEISGLVGTLAWTEGRPAIHAHASGADDAFWTVGGHVLELIVGRGSFDITVTVHSRRLERSLEYEIGAKVLQLD